MGCKQCDDMEFSIDSTETLSYTNSESANDLKDIIQSIIKGDYNAREEKERPE